MVKLGRPLSDRVAGHRAWNWWSSGSREPSEQRVLLDLQQGLLALDAAGIAGEGAVGADHPVARDDDRDRVAAVGQTHGSGGGVGAAEALGDLAVRRGVAVADQEQLGPDGLLEVRPGRGERQVELLEVA